MGINVFGALRRDEADYYDLDRPSGRRRPWLRPLSMIMSVALIAAGAMSNFRSEPVGALAPAGAGFEVTPADLAYILEQIQIAEAHVANTTSLTGPCGALVGNGPNQITSPLLAFGLRTVDGSCNHLQAGQEYFGAASRIFPRLTTPTFRDAEITPPLFGPPVPTSYAQTSGLVFDSQPRIISNLIVDQTATNPAAVSVAQSPFRTFLGEPVLACLDATNTNPLGCNVPFGETLPIENVTTDVGLSPPFNSLFTFFGQFFDHGVDKITNGGNGTVIIPLQSDDPLFDPTPGAPNFMALTRGTQIGGVHEAENTDSPFVDQSQTYTSNASHQVFLREYVNDLNAHPVSTGAFLDDPAHPKAIASWMNIKDQARDVLGIQLEDTDVNNIPMILTDPYGKFIPGPARGLPQLVTQLTPTVLTVEGDTLAPVVPSVVGAQRIGIAFLNDIAHAAGPGAIGTPKTPDADLTAGGSLDPVVPGEYDDELLDLHMICGDGRCNENIALMSVHQVFHSEHNRLAEEIRQIITADTDGINDSGILTLADWQIGALGGGGAGGWNGERLFQAARFITEMEYQHLVFEEFARKIQPLINPFEQFAFGQNEANPAIVGEFAHAVYRFGHSMLTEGIGRTDPTTGVAYDVSLFDAFLNPAEFFDTDPTSGQSGPVLSTEDAAGGILMGVSDVAGQEIDEFVTDTLRNRLVGLPLDLPVLNLSRGREQGIPRLNDLRRQIFEATQDDAMIPYTDWVDFGQGLKYATSLTNFVAAYGTHPSITVETTVAGKREAARLIAAPATPADFIARPADSDDFMFGTGAWTSPGVATITGVDDVDLWVGGLAERTNLFGGHLGNTFNYVFEYQLTTLQDDDRFYYLARTPGMNLQAQLEGNSFAELVMRNTNTHTLKMDAFAVADCKFEVSQLTSPAVAGPGNDIFGAGSVNDVPTSACNENHVLLRMSNGAWRYRVTNLDDPPGLNAQIVMNGTAAVDRMWGGVDSDTFWGNEGSDIIEGSDGGDVAHGGDGNDIITDSGGDDVHKGGPGNDYISAGPGLDLLLPGEGKDFTNGGSNINETFAGTGDDFIIAGTGADLVIAGAGDDWTEGGTGPDLLVGDASTFFFDDHDKPGNDIFVGQTGDDDYDGEGGDDILVAGPGLEKNSGTAGFDWVTGQGDSVGENFDLNRLILGDVPPVNETNDRFDEIEGASGWNFNDIIRGTSFAPKIIGGAGDIGCDALDQDGLDRIANLDQIITSLPSPAQPVRDLGVTHFCNLEGDFVWGEGEILIGGAGSDILEGRGDDDMLDGDRYLRVRLSIRTDPNNAATEIGTTTSLTGQATSGTFGAGTAGKTLATSVQNGLVDPGNIVAVREILIASDPVGVLDTAVYAGPIADYNVQTFPDGTTLVTDLTLGGGGGGVGVAADEGTDTLRNIERLQFSDTTIETPPVPTNFPPTGSVTIDNVAPTEGDLLTATQTIADGDGINAASMTFDWQAFDGLTWIAQQTTVGVASDTFLTTNAVVGMPVRVVVTYLDNDVPPVLESVTSAATAAVVNVNDVPTGAVILSDPTPQEGVLLSADATTVADADGTSGGITLQWQRSGLGGGGAFTDIAGATGTTFTPTQNEVNRRLRVEARFTDDHGTAEVVASAQTIVTGDLFIGGAGIDVWVGTAGDDIAFGGDSADDLRGQNGDDIIEGQNGDDTLRGGAGIDTFRYTGVGNGFDAVIGGTEADALEATADNTDIGLRNIGTVEFINGGPWANVVIRNGAAGNTLDFTAVTITNVVAIDGAGGTDRITGSDLGSDNILGGAAADILNGLSGADTITGGTGADAMDGGAGNDTFVFEAGFGADSITTFDADPAGGQDLLDVRPLGINGTLTGVTIAAAGLDTLVTIGANSIRLVGVAPATVNVTDFITL